MIVTKKPTVAVLMTAFNGMRWIEEQVNSILNQVGVTVTLFVSVDVSDDGTADWVKQLSGRLDNVVMLPYGQCYGGAGPNFLRLVRVVDFTGFDAVAFADQDDIWFDSKLERACSFIAAGRCDVYSSNVMAVWPDGKQKLINKAFKQKKYDHFFEAAGPGCTYVFSRSAMQAFQSFLYHAAHKANSIALHDWLAYAFCREAGYVWLLDAQPSMLYRQHERNQVGINRGFSAYLKRFRLLHAKWYRSQVMAITQLVAPRYSERFQSRIFILSNVFSLRRRTTDCLLLMCFTLFGFY